MTKMHVKKGDKVLVIAGKAKGKEGKILRAIPETQRVVVEGANMVKKAMRPTQANPSGGIATKEGTMHVSNVMLICPKCEKPTRTGVVRDEDGKKVRICKKCGKTID